MIRCALIGCGAIVEDLHMPALKAIPDVVIDSACDANPGTLEAFSRRHKIAHRYGSVEDLLAKGRDIDFAMVSTPGFSHYEICSQVLEAGWNILVEKPIALTLGETIALQGLASKKGVKAGVVQNYRYRDNVLRARNDFERGRAGAVKQVNVTFHGQSLFNEPSPWSWDEQRSKTLIYEICLHYLDLEVLFAGRCVRLIGGHRVFDSGLGCIERIYALVEHEKGAVGMIDLQFNASSNYTHVDVFGTANDMRLKFFPEYYRIYSGNINPLDEVHCDVRRIADFAIPTFKEKLVKPAVKRRAVSHFRLIKGYVDALKGGQEIPVSFDSVVPTMELAEEVSRIAYG